MEKTQWRQLQWQRRCLEFDSLCESNSASLPRKLGKMGRHANQNQRFALRSQGILRKKLCIDENKKNPCHARTFFIGDNRTRTDHLQIANLSLYQMSYIPKNENHSISKQRFFQVRFLQCGSYFRRISSPKSSMRGVPNILASSGSMTPRPRTGVWTVFPSFPKIFGAM